MRRGRCGYRKTAFAVGDREPSFTLLVACLDERIRDRLITRVEDLASQGCRVCVDFEFERLWAVPLDKQLRGALNERDGRTVVRDAHRPGAAWDVIDEERSVLGNRDGRKRSLPAEADSEVVDRAAAIGDGST